MHEQGKVVEKEGETEERCAEYIKEHGGLASSAEDKVYGVKGEYDEKGYDGITCPSSKYSSYYNQLYCNISDWKDDTINKAKKGYTYKDDKGQHKVIGFESFKTDPDAVRVQERIDEIQTFIGALEADKDEVTYLTPEDDASSVDKKKNTAKADRTASRISDDESIKTMDNQNQTVAYCPVYKKRVGN
jgi:hypothetical protein